MIEEQNYKEILDEGLLLDHWFLLCNMKYNRKLLETRRIQGFINLLTKKDYIREGTLTEKGLRLVENCEFAEVVVVPTEKEKAATVNLGEWVAELHKKCQDKLYALTRQRQIRCKIEKKTYSFLPNSTDLFKTLSKTISLYKLKDLKKIEETILRYIDNCAKSGNWFPLMQYYILKNGASQMVTEIENPEDSDEQDFRSTQKFV